MPLLSTRRPWSWEASDFEPDISQLPKNSTSSVSATEGRAGMLGVRGHPRAEAQRKEDDDAYALIRKHSPGTRDKVTKERLGSTLSARRVVLAPMT